MRTRADTRRGAAGFSLVELLIAMVTMSVMLGAVALATLRGSDAYNTGRAAADLEARAQRAIALVVEDLRWAGRTGLNPEPLAPFGSAQLDYQSNVGFQGGAVQWGPPTRLGFEYAPGEVDDGLDNNGNGVADEGSIVLRVNPGAADEQRIVRVNWVRELLEGEVANGLDDNGNGLIDEAGLSFEVSGTTLMVRLTLERPDAEGRILTRTMTTAVNLRN